MTLVQEIIIPSGSIINIVNNNTWLSFENNSFITDTGINVHSYFIDLDADDLSDLSGNIEKGNAIFSGKITNVRVCLNTKHNSFIIYFNADITMIGEAKQLEDYSTIDFDSINLSNIKITDICTSWDDFGDNKDNAIDNLTIIIEANKYKEFFEKYGITSLKDGTSIDSLSNEDLFAYIDKYIDPEFQFHYNSNIVNNLFNNPLPDGEIIYKYCEDFITKTVNGSTLETISKSNCKEAFILTLTNDEDFNKQEDKKIHSIYNQYIIN